MNFADRLKLLRQEEGISQEKLGGNTESRQIGSFQL